MKPARLKGRLRPPVGGAAPRPPRAGGGGGPDPVEREVELIDLDLGALRLERARIAPPSTNEAPNCMSETPALVERHVYPGPIGPAIEREARRRRSGRPPARHRRQRRGRAGRSARRQVDARGGRSAPGPAQAAGRTGTRSARAPRTSRCRARARHRPRWCGRAGRGGIVTCSSPYSTGSACSIRRRADPGRVPSPSVTRGAVAGPQASSITPPLVSPSPPRFGWTSWEIRRAADAAGRVRGSGRPRAAGRSARRRPRD